MSWRKSSGWMVIVAGSLALGACTVPTKKIDYKSTPPKLPALDVPPDLTSPSTDDRFQIPDVNPKGTATFSEYAKDRGNGSRIVSTGAAILPQVENAHVARAGTQRWLVVPGSPEMVWPMVKDFWQETGLIVNVEKPEAGVMETEWSENRAKIPESGLRGFIGKALDSIHSTAERDKFRTRLERGAQPGTTEIYISHRGMEEVYINTERDQTRWQPRPPDPDLEAEMLYRLLVRFGADTAQARTQIAAAPVKLQARLNKGPEGSLLALNDQFDRAWRRVGLALDRVGFTVEDRDRSKGVYFVRYIDADAKANADKSWLSSLKFWSSNPPAQKEQYRIHVQDATAGAEVRVLNKGGTREQSETANRILTLLYDQLK